MYKAMKASWTVGFFKIYEQNVLYLAKKMRYGTKRSHFYSDGGVVPEAVNGNRCITAGDNTYLKVKYLFVY